MFLSALEAIKDIGSPRCKELSIASVAFMESRWLPFHPSMKPKHTFGRELNRSPIT